MHFIRSLRYHFGQYGQVRSGKGRISTCRRRDLCRKDSDLLRRRERFNLLVREMKQSKIHLEFENTPIYNSAYIEGIANLYEFDCGELSGWMYRVNGWFPNYGCSRYELQDGDKVEWLYTCDLGADIGGGDSTRNGR